MTLLKFWWRVFRQWREMRRRRPMSRWRAIIGRIVALWWLDMRAQRRP